MNNWINVKERLPNKLQKVLFIWEHGGNRNVSMGYICDEGWDIYLPYHSYKMNPDHLTVTHWMELPEFPERLIMSHREMREAMDFYNE